MLHIFYSWVLGLWQRNSEMAFLRGCLVLINFHVSISLLPVYGLTSLGCLAFPAGLAGPNQQLLLCCETWGFLALPTQDCSPWDPRGSERRDLAILTCCSWKQQPRGWLSSPGFSSLMLDETRRRLRPPAPSAKFILPWPRLDARSPWRHVACDLEAKKIKYKIK